MLGALGYRFLDRSGQPLALTAENLDLIHCVDSRGAVDLGDRTHRRRRRHQPTARAHRRRRGFGPQKGATAAQVAQLDAGLENLVAAFTRPDTPSRHRRPRSRIGCRRRYRLRRDAAGRQHRLGSDYFLDLLDFDRHVGDVDL